MVAPCSTPWMTASFGSTGSAVGAADAEAEASADADADAAAVAVAAADAGALGDGDAAVPQAPTTSAMSAVRTMVRRVFMLLLLVASLVGSALRCVVDVGASRLPDVAHLPPSVARSRSADRLEPDVCRGDRHGAPGARLGFGWQDLDDVGRQELGRRRGRGAEPRQLAVDRLGERGARVGDAAADDDPLDVVGHDEEMDRPGEPAADIVDEVGGM